MVKKLMLAIAAVALLATPSFAAVQNVKVSGDITTTSILTTNIPTPGINASNVKGNDFLTQTEIFIDADLTDNVSTKIGLLNEHVWGNTSTTNGYSADAAAVTGVDLETAYVTMKEFLYSPLTLTVGRQPLVYGNSLIVASNYYATNLPAPLAALSKKGNFDAVKAVLSYNPLTIDVFASRIVDKNTYVATASQRANNDNLNLYGINANYKLGDKMSTVLEAYFFAKMDDTSIITSTTAGTNTVKAQDTYVPGLRVSTNPIEGLNVQLEGAYEAGHVVSGTVTQARDAYAFQGMVNYALPVLKDLKPVVSAEYKYLSGRTIDGTGSTKIGKTWDPMFGNQDVGRIFNDLGLSSSDLQLVELSGSLTPIKDLTTALSWYGVWNAVQSAQQVNTGSTPTNSSMYKGSEVDADLTYAYTEDVKFGLSASLFLTGKNYVASEAKNATQVLTSVSVAF